MQFQDALARYLRFLQVQGRSLKTQKNHRLSLSHYHRCLQQEQQDWQTVSEEWTSPHLAIYAETHSEAHTRIYRCTLTAFYDFGVRNQWVERSPFAVRPSPRPSLAGRLKAHAIPDVDLDFALALMRFYDRLLGRGHSEKTARFYEYQLLHLGRHLKQRRLSFIDATESDLEEFLNLYRRHRLRPARPGSRYTTTRSATTVSQMDNAVRSFYNWAARSKLIASSPAAYLEPARRDKPVRRAVKESVVEELVDKLNNPPADLEPAAEWRWQRDRMVILVFLFTGLRLSECADLTWEHVDLDEATATVVRKGGDAQIIPLHPALVSELRRYKGTTKSGYLFRSYRGGAFGAHGISEMFRTFIQGKLGINCTAHQLRHTFATVLLRKGADILAIQKLLGHASVKTTQIYADIADDAPAHALEFLPGAWSQSPTELEAKAQPPEEPHSAPTPMTDGQQAPPQLSMEALSMLLRTFRKAA
jgi:site-specific recombinase XerD